MDMRTALPSGSRLDFTNHEGGKVSYVIKEEIGRGGSCIVYDATYTTNMGDDRVVRIKECYPFGLRIKRGIDGILLPSVEDQEAFLLQKEQLKQAFLRNNRLFAVEGITNSVSNTVDLYEGYQTCYVVTTYMGGETLENHVCSDLRECLSLTRSTAKAVEKIHRAGYLYLDLKPDNIFVIHGTTDLVQLFDFDSTVLLKDSQECAAVRISYTRGFAALEQQVGNGRKLGFFTDVFAIGAVLFYELFGRTPTAMDCDAFAQYDFGTMHFPASSCSDKLLRAITDFFHQTLLPFAPARIQTMQQVVDQLTAMLTDADTLTPWLVSTQIPKPKSCLGRDGMIRRIQELAEKESVISVTGMGGIGKSTLVLQWLSLHRAAYDAVLFLSWNGSARLLITDDTKLTMNTVSHLKGESTDEYYTRKLRRLREQACRQKTLLVLDNMEPEAVNQLKDILDIGWQMILISRQQLPGLHVSEIHVPSLEEAALFDVFESNLQTEVSEEQEEAVYKILKYTGYHTLAVELIAKQIRAGFFSVEQAADLVCESGFTDTLRESVDYEKDQAVLHTHMFGIMNRLFEVDRLTQEEKNVMKLLSLFQPDGIDGLAFRYLSNLKNMDSVNRLNSIGWISVTAGNLQLHPLTDDYVQSWPWNDYRAAAEKLMEQLYRMIRQEGGTHTRTEPYYPDIEKQTPAHYQQLWNALQLAEKVLRVYREKSSIRQRLLYHLAMDVPIDQEENMVSRAMELLSEPELLDSGSIQRLCSETAFILGRMDRYRDAEKMLKRMELFLRQRPSAFYLSLLNQMRAILKYNEHAAQADLKIDRECLHTLDRAIFFARLSHHPDNKKQLAACLLSKATTLMTLPYPPVKECHHVMEEAIGLMTQYAKEYDYVRYQCFCIASMYFAGIGNDPEMAYRCMLTANTIADTGRDSDLAWIDHVWEEEVPLLLDMERYDEAADEIANALQLCSRYSGVAPYLRARAELLSLLHVIRNIAGKADDKELAVKTDEIKNQMETEPEV